VTGAPPTPRHGPDVVGRVARLARARPTPHRRRPRPPRSMVSAGAGPCRLGRRPGGPPAYPRHPPRALGHPCGRRSPTAGRVLPGTSGAGGRAGGGPGTAAWRTSGAGGRAGGGPGTAAWRTSGAGGPAGGGPGTAAWRTSGAGGPAGGGPGTAACEARPSSSTGRRTAGSVGAAASRRPSGTAFLRLVPGHARRCVAHCRARGAHPRDQHVHPRKHRGCGVFRGSNGLEFGRAPPRSTRRRFVRGSPVGARCGNPPVAGDGPMLRPGAHGEHTDRRRVVRPALSAWPDRR